MDKYHPHLNLDNTAVLQSPAYDYISTLVMNNSNICEGLEEV
jgi:hypothetical protein